MKFEDALTAMREGKKTCRKNRAGYLYIDEELLLDQFDDTGHLAFFDIMKDDWEIVE